MSSDQKPSRKRLMLLGIGGLTLAALLVANGLAARSRHEQAVVGWTEAAALPVVNVFQPLQNAHGDTLRLPAHLEAWSKAPIHARVNGYLKSWTSDIGSKVKAGQVLAVIDSPDLDQQLAQAHAHILRVAVPVLLGRYWIAPLLLKLAAQYPALELEMVFSSRAVDQADPNKYRSVQLPAK